FQRIGLRDHLKQPPAIRDSVANKVIQRHGTSIQLDAESMTACLFDSFYSIYVFKGLRCRRLSECKVYKIILIFFIQFFHLLIKYQSSFMNDQCTIANGLYLRKDMR